MKRVLLHSIAAGFAGNWIRDQPVQPVLPETLSSAPPATEKDIYLCFQDQRKRFLLFSESTSLTLPKQFF